MNPSKELAALRKDWTWVTVDAGWWCEKSRKYRPHPDCQYEHQRHPKARVQMRVRAAMRQSRGAK